MDPGRLWAQLSRLAEFREPDQPGWTRRVFSEPYGAAREWLSQEMAEAGLRVTRDAAGNLVGETDGEPGRAGIAIGSHTDTVIGGGRFDGTLGVLGAIEVARLLRQSGRRLRHPLRVVDFLGEEPNRFGLSCLGSRAVAANLDAPALELRDQAGETLGSALERIGVRPQGLAAAAWSGPGLHAYFELHIEQGTRLERAGLALGVVTTICGIHRARVALTGRPDHAGTTAMGERRDALALAAQLVLLVEELASQEVAGARGVGTVGRLLVGPGASNVVPGEAELGLELRSADPRWLQDRSRALEGAIARLGALRRIETELRWVSTEPPVPCSPRCRELIVTAVTGLGQQVLELESGAGHDAAQVARLGPVGMILVPSRQGRSHCPEEWTDPDHAALGVEALRRTVLEADRAERV